LEIGLILTGAFAQPAFRLLSMPEIAKGNFNKGYKDISLRSAK